MENIKVMTIFGTRPEAIKMAPLIKELEKTENVESIVCVTAQHREMLDQVLKAFDINPDYDLNIMTDRQTLTGITVRALEGLESIIKEVNPNIVLVHGDTTTTFVGSLAAFYNKVKIGHVEAGLRTYNKYEPFPEEMNRKLTASLVDLHFAPTELAKQNLIKESINEEEIYVTGNTVIDALKTTVEENYRFKLNLLNKLNYKDKQIITVTAHRRENLGEPLRNICFAIKEIAQEFKNVEIVYAVHKNPAVRECVFEILGEVERVHLIEPLNMNDMHNLLKRSYLVLTDSGGLQEEVPSLGKPVLVLRNVTERPEGVKAGTLKLVGVDESTIYEATKLLLTDKDKYNEMAQAKNPYGDGEASRRIVEAIKYYFSLTKCRPKDFTLNSMHKER